ncbi:MAG: glycine--tRNA ligase, partial [FCB group bacterium]|nr:glycine--tRNA ligase [FCB group bacterium]
MEKIVSLCKRRGLIFQSSEIYGGLNSCWDYGPLGIELKNAIRNVWWKEMTQLHPEIVGIDASILMHPRVWEASGHVEGFTDPMVDCKDCKLRFREDDMPDENRESSKCPSCGGQLTEPRNFNLMFKTFMGPVEESAAAIYLRPETAQGIYVNYLTVMNASRLKPPFGIAQTGKAFRNEITPGNFIFRTREFEQMEMQYFVHPGEADEVFETWMNKRMDYYYRLGIKQDKLRFYEHPQNKLAHYAKRAVDIEYEFPWGWGELEGVHNRTDFDLRRHQEYSGKDLTYFDEQSRERYLPYIIETASGLNRTLLVTLLDGYEEEQLEKETRTVLKFSPHIAPMQVGIFPLVKKGG